MSGLKGFWGPVATGLLAATVSMPAQALLICDASLESKPDRKVSVSQIGDTPEDAAKQVVYDVERASPGAKPVLTGFWGMNTNGRQPSDPQRTIVFECDQGGATERFMVELGGSCDPGQGNGNKVCQLVL